VRQPLRLEKKSIHYLLRSVGKSILLLVLSLLPTYYRTFQQVQVLRNGKLRYAKDCNLCSRNCESYAKEQVLQDYPRSSEERMRKKDWIVVRFRFTFGC
jgi:hypothetical protein